MWEKCSYTILSQRQVGYAWGWSDKNSTKKFFSRQTFFAGEHVLSDSTFLSQNFSGKTVLIRTDLEGVAY